MEEAEVSHMQNIIIRALGSEATVDVDVDDMVALPGDILLLATDGMTKHIKDAKDARAGEVAPPVWMPPMTP